MVLLLQGLFFSQYNRSLTTYMQNVGVDLSAVSEERDWWFCNVQAGFSSLLSVFFLHSSFLLSYTFYLFTHTHGVHTRANANATGNRGIRSGSASTKGAFHHGESSSRCRRNYDREWNNHAWKGQPALSASVWCWAAHSARHPWAHSLMPCTDIHRHARTRTNTHAHAHATTALYLTQTAGNRATRNTSTHADHTVHLTTVQQCNCRWARVDQTIHPYTARHILKSNKCEFIGKRNLEILFNAGSVWIFFFFFRLYEASTTWNGVCIDKFGLHSTDQHVTAPTKTVISLSLPPSLSLSLYSQPHHTFLHPSSSSSSSRGQARSGNEYGPLTDMADWEYMGKGVLTYGCFTTRNKSQLCAHPPILPSHSCQQSKTFWAMRHPLSSAPTFACVLTTPSFVISFWFLFSFRLSPQKK